MGDPEPEPACSSFLFPRERRWRRLAGTAGPRGAPHFPFNLSISNLKLFIHLGFQGRLSLN